MDLGDQLLRLYEDGITDLRTLARSLLLPETEVHRLLFERSPAYRTTAASNPGGGVMSAEEALSVISDIARHSTSDITRLSAAKFLRDDLKGRRDPISIDAGLNEPVIEAFAKRMAALRERRQAFLNDRVIDIPAQ